MARRLSGRGGIAVLVAALLAARWLLPEYPLFVLSLALVNIAAVQGVNLVMGYAGQVSLGHAGFAAIGAYVAALLAIHAAVPFWGGLVIGAGAAGVAGYLLGFPALRLSPLYVAMVTFGFGQCVMLVAQNWVDVTRGPNGLTVPPPSLFGRELTPADFHLVIVAAVVALFWWARNIVQSRVGRAFVAIRESELAARTMGVHPAQYKTVAFAVGAVYAGVSGGLYAGLSQFINPDAFVFPVSIAYVTMGILGGLGSLAGPALGGTLLTILPEALRGAQEYKEFLTGLLLLLLLIFLPRGITGLVAGFPSHDVPLPTSGRVPSAAPAGAPRPATSAARHPVLELEGLSVRFGGLWALQRVALAVWPREILGLIGPNGAGKTTLFNAVTGLYRVEDGSIRLEGRDLHALPAHARARLGIARTFQNLEIFREMSVLDNVLAGMHGRLQTRWLGTSLRTRPERLEERAAEDEARRLLDFVGLGDAAGRPAESLSFGHQRLLEIARALAARPRLLLLDEPAAGLSAGEIGHLTAVIRRLRDEGGITVLLVAHTMRLVMGVSDRVVVLDHGEKIAEGTPAEVRVDRQVIAAYLGSHHETAGGEGHA